MKEKQNKIFFFSGTHVTVTVDDRTSEVVVSLFISHSLTLSSSLKVRIGTVEVSFLLGTDALSSSRLFMSTRE
jgi:hypothetical protein